MRKLLALVAVLALVVTGFLGLPRLISAINGGHEQRTSDQAVPLAGAKRPAGSPSSDVGASNSGARRIEDFATLQREAGFTVLTPSTLPPNYQPWERYLRSTTFHDVLVSYRKEPNLYMLISERSIEGSSSLGRSLRLFGVSTQPTPVDVNGVGGLYVQAEAIFLRRFSGDAQYAMAQPHAVVFRRGDVQVTVEAEQTDVPRDALLRIAAGLR